MIRIARAAYAHGWCTRPRCVWAPWLCHGRHRQRARSACSISASARAPGPATRATPHEDHYQLRRPVSGVSRVTIHPGGATTDHDVHAALLRVLRHCECCVVRGRWRVLGPGDVPLCLRAAQRQAGAATRVHAFTRRWPTQFSSFADSNKLAVLYWSNRENLWPALRKFRPSLSVPVHTTYTCGPCAQRNSTC